MRLMSNITRHKSNKTKTTLLHLNVFRVHEGHHCTALVMIYRMGKKQHRQRRRRNVKNRPRRLISVKNPFPYIIGTHSKYQTAGNAHWCVITPKTSIPTYNFSDDDHLN